VASQGNSDDAQDSGQNTKKPLENQGFREHQERIGKMEDRAKADGTVTKKERARIHHAQDQESKRIYRQKHDRQHAK